MTSVLLSLFRWRAESGFDSLLKRKLNEITSVLLNLFRWRAESGFGNLLTRKIYFYNLFLDSFLYFEIEKTRN